MTDDTRARQLSRHSDVRIGTCRPDLNLSQQEAIDVITALALIIPLQRIDGQLLVAAQLASAREPVHASVHAVGVTAQVDLRTDAGVTTQQCYPVQCCRRAAGKRKEDRHVVCSGARRLRSGPAHAWLCPVCGIAVSRRSCLLRTR